MQNGTLTDPASESKAKRREEYANYRRTPQWQARRIEALDRAGRRCQLCNSDKQLDVHHRTYERIFNEDPNDLTVLCRRCHERFHGKDKPAATKPRQRKKKPKVRSERVVGPMALRSEPEFRSQLNPLLEARAQRVLSELRSVGGVLTVRELSDRIGLAPNLLAPVLSVLHQRKTIVKKRKAWMLR